jgi:hypothetical protein
LLKLRTPCIAVALLDGEDACGDNDPQAAGYPAKWTFTRMRFLGIFTNIIID